MSEKYSESSANQCKEKTSGQQLTNNSAPICTQCNTDRDLSFARRPSNKKQMRNIRTGNQEYQANRSEQDHQRLARTANEIFVHGRQVSTPACIAARIFLFQSGIDHIERYLCLPLRCIGQ